MTHAEKAKELFLSGCNCAQAVFGAFCDETGMDRETAMRLCSSMGAGMGGLREVCGAVSGAFLAAGLLLGDSGCDPQKKKEHYARLQALAQRFQAQHGSLLCRDLLRSLQPGAVPAARTAAYYKTRPCAIFVEDMAELLDQLLAEEKAKTGKARCEQ